MKDDTTSESNNRGHETEHRATSELCSTGWVEPNPHFTTWTKTLPAKHWARYDLSACRLGWEAAVAWMQGGGNPGSTHGDKPRANEN